MSLSEIVDSTLTDKHTTHSYLELYEKLLNSKKETTGNILEVGIGNFGEKNGGSIKMWRDYFLNATIYGIDILSKDRVIDELINHPRVILLTEIDAYNEDFFQTTFLSKNIKCEMMLDDGPHTLESMKQFIKLYSQLLSEDGILIIEDVQSYDWIDILKTKYQIILKNL